MKHTKEQMQVVINEWQTSGLNKKEFCRQRNIKYQNFHYWCKRLISVPSTGFTEVRVQQPEVNAECEVLFPSGARLILHREPSADWLRELLR